VFHPSQILFDSNFSVALISQLDFDLTHSEVGEDGSKAKRVMHLTDLMGNADRWVRVIGEYVHPQACTAECLSFHTHGSVCCACAQKPGLPRVLLRLARLPRTASSSQRLRRFRSTRAAAPVLLAHAEVTTT
jgi:hypothetical protein